MIHVPQLLAVLRWREHTKDPDTLRLILWVEGYQIPTAEVRATLVRWWENAIVLVDREFRARAERLGLDPDRDEDRPAVLQEVSRELAAKRGPRSIPRRGRIPAAERAHALDVLLRRFLLDLPADGDVEQEAQKIEKVLGIAQGRTGTIPGSGPWLTGPAAPLLDAADIIAAPRLLEAARTATDAELETARQTVRAMFQYLPFMVRLIDVITGEDNHVGLAGLRDVDQNSEFLFFLTPMIVGMLKAGLTDNLQTVTAALDNMPEMAQQVRELLDMPASTVQANLASAPPERRDHAQRILDGALNGELDLPPRPMRPNGKGRRPVD